MKQIPSCAGLDSNLCMLQYVHAHHWRLFAQANHPWSLNYLKNRTFLITANYGSFKPSFVLDQLMFRKFKTIFAIRNLWFSVGMTYVKIDCLKVAKIIFLVKTSNNEFVGFIWDPNLKILLQIIENFGQKNLKIS